MKITGVRTQRAVVPFDKPIQSATHFIPGISAVLVWLDTDEGITGEALLWAVGPHRLPVLEEMVKLLGTQAIGKDPRDTSARFDDMWAENSFLGHKGLTMYGLSAIDCACWDILGKSMGVSISRLLGKRRDRVPAYASGGLWASRSMQELEDEAKSFVAQGFKAVKMRVGKFDIAEDIERVTTVRNAIGPKIKLMADANQGLTVSQAIRLGRRLEDFDLTWFEEPVPAHDLEGHGLVAAALDTPIASGETEYGRYGFRDMLERKSADILMPDLERVGGVTEWMRVAAMAASYDVPVSPHLYTEYSLQLVGAASNATFSEHMPWFAPLYAESMEMEDGDILIPDRPGFGFSFDPAAIEKYAVA